MNIRIFLCVITVYFGSYSMTFKPYKVQNDARYRQGYIQVSLCKELYPFFASRMGIFSHVEQTSYDSQNNVASCYFKEVIDTEALKNRKAFLQMLRTKTKPRRGHKNRPFFVLNSFVELERILDQTKIFIFNQGQCSLMLNPAFLSTPIQAPDLIEYFESIEPDLHACAYIAQVPVVPYSVRN
ncbi:hypothetical protein BH09DEP1_BH09DEP1_4510 [soil metagenome]